MPRIAALIAILTSGLLAAPVLATRAPRADTARASSPVIQRGRGAPPVASPEVQPDRRVTFRVRAPEAAAIRVVGGDMPSIGRGVSMSKSDDGVWSLTVGPVPAGAYRYAFDVDGVNGTDPRNPATSESNNTTWSLVLVPGDDRYDTRDVPHGAVAEVLYASSTLGRTRRLHVYTPPGYEAGTERYPVFYLLHGAGDSDDSWTTVGRAGIILDNLIASGDATPMVVVMPAGHTRLDGGGAMGDAGTAEFVREFLDDIVPTIEARYRVRTGRGDRAIAGLSMGGHQTLNVAMAALDRFAHVGVYSSGLLGAFGGREGDAPPPLSDAGRRWESRHADALADADVRRGLRTLWFATGEDDFLLDTTVGTVALFERHGFTPVFVETAGGHTWLNWRDYLAEFVPLLFR